MADSSNHGFRVTAAPIPEGLVELHQLREQLWATEGWAIGLDMKGLQRTWKVFHANWAILNSLIGRFKGDRAFAMSVVGTSRDQTKLDSFLDALDVALHNFIASAATLGDHTRRIAKCRVAADAWPRYQTEVDRVFGDDPRSRFVKDLRNYMLHFTLPLTAGSFSYERDGPFTHAITVATPELLHWDRWNPLARDYLQSVGEELDLHDCLAGYMTDTLEFQKWFGRYVREVNLEALDGARELADRGNEMVGPIQARLDGPIDGEIELPYVSGRFRKARSGRDSTISEASIHVDGR